MRDDQDDSNGSGRQPWFGPKRFGIGYRPQTWQGFLITFLGVIAVIVVKGTGHNWKLTVLPALALLVIAAAM